MATQQVGVSTLVFPEASTTKICADVVVSVKSPDAPGPEIEVEPDVEPALTPVTA